MKVNLDKTFPIEAPASNGWKFLQDIPGVASCMPGAEITETVDDSHYKGLVKSKIGPATMAFNGDIEIKGIDAEKHELHLVGHGQDTKGTSSATMDLTAWIVEVEGGHCELKGKAEVSVTGKAASLGGRMMTQVADQILNQFGANFAAQLEPAAADAGDGEPPTPPATELNALALLWGIVAGFFKRLFGGKS